jgi:hypothetical protein
VRSLDHVLGVEHPPRSLGLRLKALVFLAYLTGLQRHFRMISGQEGARSIIHLSELLRLADRAGLIADPAQAAAKMRRILSLAGID